jgi:exodeoxyribonuclease V gamma subunit
MLFLADTPSILFQAIADSISVIRDPRARHWLILPGRGRAEWIRQLWAKKGGIASHSQEVQLRELLEQATAAGATRFDFERLRLAIATALPELLDLPDFPIPKSQPSSPITGVVLDWATTLAKAVDEELLCRTPEHRSPPEHFLHKLARHPSVASALQGHVGLADSGTFEHSALEWIRQWSERGGIPHLWLQLDAGLPGVQFTRLLQLTSILHKHHPDRIHLFALSPSSEYWGEARLRGKNRSPEHADTELHPGGLLWAFGRCSQDLHRQLSATFLAEAEGGFFLSDPDSQNSLLGKLQLSCRRSAPLAPHELHSLDADDSSLTVHSARSTLRELEVCRDRILQARIELPDLRYEEILLLLADPKRQAPFLEAAFRFEDSESKTLPYRLLGSGKTVPSTLAESVSLLLKKLRGRLALDDLQQLIEDPLIGATFHFHQSKQEGHDIVAWLRDAQFRWGVDETHRFEHQPFQEHRWNLFWALQRLGLGAFVAPKNQHLPLELPHPASRTVALERTSGLGLTTLAQLAKFAVSLESARTIWTSPEPLPTQAWCEHLLHLTDSFLKCKEGSPSLHLATLKNSILPSLIRAATPTQTVLTSDAFIRLLNEKLDGISESSTRGISGICVADLKQYAGLPARLTIIAGLDDSIFPRRDDRPSWHPLLKLRQVGDPSLRDADRHALLLALLACKERLVLTYQGGSDKDAKERPPSTVISDIFQAIDQSATSKNHADAPHRKISYTHALNGFSPISFLSSLTPNERNFLGSDYTAANLIASESTFQPFPGPWSTAQPETSQKPPTTLKLGDLKTLFDEPARIFLQTTGISLPKEESEIESGDLLSPNQLHQWSLSSRLMTAMLEQQELARLIDVFNASGVLPRANLGATLCESLQSKIPTPPQPLSANERLQQSCTFSITHPCDPKQTLRLQCDLKEGWYLPKDSQEALFFSASSNSTKHLLGFFLEALTLPLMCDSDGTKAPPKTASARFKSAVKKDSPITLSLPTPQRARELLEAILPLYFLAQRIPLPFSPAAFESALKRFKKEKGFPPELIPFALSDAHQMWLKGPYNGVPDAEKPAIRYAFRGCPNPFAWQPSLENNEWLPDASQPFAWRVIAFVQSWIKATGFPF